MKGTRGHIKFLKSLLLLGEVSFLSKNSKGEFVIETKLYLDGDIVCKVFSENEEEVIDKHIKMIKKQVNMLRHLSKYITAFITTITTTAGYLVQLESNIPNNLGLILPTAGLIIPLFFKKQFFGSAMSIFTFITKTFTKDSLKSFTN